MYKIHSAVAILAIATLGFANVQAKDGPTLRIENTGSQFMVRKFDNAEQCSAKNRGKMVGISGRRSHGGGARHDNIDIDVTPGQPFEIVLSDDAAAGGRFRIEPEEGVEYLARLRREGDVTWLGLHSRPHGSEQEFTPLAQASTATHPDDVCPHARWARIDFDAPAPSAPQRERMSPTLRNELVHEQRRIEQFGN